MYGETFAMATEEYGQYQGGPYGNGETHRHQKPLVTIARHTCGEKESSWTSGLVLDGYSSRRSVHLVPEKVNMDWLH